MLWNIRKIWGIMLVFSLMILLAGCGTNTSGKEALTPTGYPSVEVQRITVYYQGNRYWYTDGGFDRELGEGFEKAGTVETVDNQSYQDEEWTGTRLEEGQEIYASEEDDSRIYVRFENGFAELERQEESLPE